jgi:hypothetical protein
MFVSFFLKFIDDVFGLVSFLLYLVSFLLCHVSFRFCFVSCFTITPVIISIHVPSNLMNYFLRVMLLY